MKKNILIIWLFGLFSSSFAQNFTLQKCHSHNDYLHKIPFFDAYNLGFGSIEVDVFLVNNQLLVAHEKRAIDSV